MEILPVLVYLFWPCKIAKVPWWCNRAKEETLRHSVFFLTPTSAAQRFRFRCSSPSPSVPFWGCTWLRPSSLWPSPEPSPPLKTPHCERKKERNHACFTCTRGNIDTENLYHRWVDGGHSEADRRVHTNNILGLFAENGQSCRLWPTAFRVGLRLALVHGQKHGKHF